jgi:hypothetical protein
VQTTLPLFETTPTSSERAVTLSPPAPENSTAASSSDVDVSDNIETIEAPPSSGTRVHRKPRRLQGQIASQLNQGKYSPDKITVADTADMVETAQDFGTSENVEEQGVAGWRAKTPGAIMYSELRGIPTMYDQRLPRIPWEFQSFVNLGERCAIMWREQTGHSPPGDPYDNDMTVMRGYGDATESPEDSEFDLDYMEFQPSEDGTYDYEESTSFSSQSSQRENNTSPCKGKSFTGLEVFFVAS